MRAKRWINLGFLSSVLDMLFSIFCNYGQSILRPITGLIVNVIVFTYTYLFVSTCWFNQDLNWPASLVLSSVYSMPFVVNNKFSREQSIEILFSENLPMWLHFVFTFQGLISCIFLFLIGLGLRNRFRI